MVKTLYMVSYFLFVIFFSCSTLYKFYQIDQNASDNFMMFLS